MKGASYSSRDPRNATEIQYRRPKISVPIPPPELPSAVNLLDHQIDAEGACKADPDLSARVKELTREVGQLRYEIQFY
jgi:hypothetical protein